MYTDLISSLQVNKKGNICISINSELTVWLRAAPKLKVQHVGSSHCNYSMIGSVKYLVLISFFIYRAEKRTTDLGYYRERFLGILTIFPVLWVKTESSSLEMLISHFPCSYS